MFLHGFNVPFDDALRQTAELAFDLSFEGAPILYSWPSAGIYPVGTGMVGPTGRKFLEFLKLVRTQIGADTVHVIAHSLGSQVLVNALGLLDLMPQEKDAAPLRHIVVAAPDIDSKTFTTLAEDFNGKAERITLYASKRDYALGWISKWVHALRGRAGAEIRAYPYVDTIDASVVCPDVWCHALLRSALARLSRFGGCRRVK